MEQELLAYWLDLMNDEEAKPQDRLRASELLARALGMFDAKAGKDDITIKLVTDTGRLMGK